MNVLITTLRAYWAPIKLLKELIQKFLNFLGQQLKSLLPGIFRKATRRLKKLGHLYKFNLLKLPPDYTRGDFYPVNEGEGRKYACYSYEDEDIDEIQSLLDQYIIGFEGNKANNRVIGYRIKPNEVPDEFGFKVNDFTEIDFEKLAADLDNFEIPDFNVDVEPEEKFIYDIELPDGTIIKNISEEGLDFFKENYVLRYMNAVTQSITDALKEFQSQ
jgi:hypothetical protein